MPADDRFLSNPGGVTDFFFKTHLYTEKKILQTGIDQGFYVSGNSVIHLVYKNKYFLSTLQICLGHL